MVHNILNLASYLTGRFADINLAESKKQRHSMKKGVLKNCTKFTEKYLCIILFLIKLKVFFTEHIRMTVSEISTILINLAKALSHDLAKIHG